MTTTATVTLAEAEAVKFRLDTLLDALGSKFALAAAELNGAAPTEAQLARSAKADTALQSWWSFDQQCASGKGKANDQAERNKRVRQPRNGL